MAFFVVRMSHPDGPGWGQHVKPHVDYLKSLIAAGKIRASGPATGHALRTGVIIFTAEDRAEVERLVAADPFAQEGLIAELDIFEWDPLFGLFAAESSGRTITG